MRKKITVFLFVFFFIFIDSGLLAQTAKNSWAFGFGGTYPKFISITTTSVEKSDNIGGFLSFQRNFNEYTSLRLKTSFLKMKSLSYKNLPRSNWINETTQLFAADFDFIYHFLPCSFITPYALLGFGAAFFTVDNAPTPSREGSHSNYQMNLGLGANLNFSSSWGIRVEVNYHTVNDNGLEGNSDLDEIKGILGSNGDTYMTFGVGVLYYFAKGEESGLCKELPTGVKEIIKEVPVVVEKKVTDTVFVKSVPYQRKLVLFGVNFEFDKATLRPESYPILEHVLNELKSHPDVRVEIRGYTDSIGTELYNLRLSKRRAEKVKKFLVENGIDPRRIYTKAMGESNPIRSNATKIGRAFNRRIEFKIFGTKKVNKESFQKND